MKSKEVIAVLANNLEWTSKDVADMLSALGSAVGTKLLEGDTVCLSSFGLFEARKKKEHISVDSVDGKKYLIPPKLIPIFRPDTNLINRIKELDSNE